MSVGVNGMGRIGRLPLGAAMGVAHRPASLCWARVLTASQSEPLRRNPYWGDLRSLKLKRPLNQHHFRCILPVHQRRIQSA